LLRIQALSAAASTAPPGFAYDIITLKNNDKVTMIMWTHDR